MFVETREDAIQYTDLWRNAVTKGEETPTHAARMLRYCGATHPNREIGDIILYAAQEFEAAL